MTPESLHAILQRRVQTLEADWHRFATSMLDKTKDPSKQFVDKAAADAVAGGIYELVALARHLGLAPLAFQLLELEFTDEELARYPG